jgi:alpha-L-rhamnosidase
LTSLSAGALPLNLSGLLDGTGIALQPSSTSEVSLYNLFKEPSNQYRPMVRWWWNGDRVVPAEILRELDVLAAAGIGGVEINPIRFPSEADPMNTRSLSWLSDEWIKVLEAATKGAKERGMTCDMIVGSGWPYGGEFLSREDQTQMVALGTKNVSGPQRVQISPAELLNSVSPTFVSPYKDSRKELFQLRLVPSQLSSITASVDLDDQLHRDFVSFDVPAGEHVLYFLVKITGFMRVINGAPGATGPVLNHYSEQAVARYLDRLSDKLSVSIGPLGEHFRAFFTDSIELEGANWCDDMLPEFSQRRGYDLSPWIPFVLFKVGEMGNAVTEEYGASFSAELKAQINLVRYDFETTKHELFQERFVATFAKWCRRNGVKSRMQAYGMDCDAITAGMLVDIPECETWIRSEQVERFGSGDYRRGRSYTMINKFVSSSAHLAGKQLISCEEMTNTDDPFHASLERIKIAGDQSMLSGVTQSVLHGFNYSPPDAPFPGWVRYGTYFSERNTWWPYFKLWTDYKARLSALFQHSVMQADIAILPPLADLASRHGFQRDPFPQTVDPPYLYKIWEVVHQNGSGCDYLTEEIISKSIVKSGRLVFGDRSYKAIVLPEVESIHPATARVLTAFVEGGGTVLFIGKTPHSASGLMANTSQSRIVENLIQSTRDKYPHRTPVVTISEENMVDWYRALQKQYGLEPDVIISKPTDFISQLHYVSGNKDIFFFTNYGPQSTHTFEATFDRSRVNRRMAWLWDPESGHRSPYPVHGTNNVLAITLGPSESKLIVFELSSEAERHSGSGANTQPMKTSSDDSISGHSIAGPWNVELIHVNGTTQSKVLQDLTDLSEREDLRSFAGTIIHTNHFRNEDAGQRLMLDLGHLHSVSQVEVNGRPLGTRWYGDHQYDLSGVLHPGVNEVKIKVVTTLGNYMKTLPKNQTARTWTEHTPFYSLGLTQPVYLRPMA